MSCLILRIGDKISRKIPVSPDGQYRYSKLPGEVFRGEFDRECGPTYQSYQPTNQLIYELDKKLGKHGGDWIKYFVAPVAKVLGKDRCAACEVRRVITNAYATLKSKHGTFLALVKIFRLWKLSMKDPDEAAKRLKELIS